MFRIAMGALLAGLVGATGCAADEIEAARPLEDDATADRPPEAGREIELARVTDRHGGSVRWIAPEGADDAPEIVIAAVYPNPPLVAPEFAREHSAIAVFLAVTAEGTEVPAGLARYAPVQPESLGRAALAAANRAMIDRSFADFDPSLATQRAAEACDEDPTFRSWVRSTYGLGYGDSSTCNANTGFTDDVFSTYYCEPGPSNDCKYAIGGLDSCYPDADENCSAFEGELFVSRARHHLYSDAYYQYNMNGHRYRFAAANCNGSGNMDMWRKRGGGDWALTVVGPRSMQIRTGGRADLPSSAGVTSVVAYGSWQQHTPMSGDTYQLNQLIIDPLAGSPGGYACADVQREFEVFDITSPFCNAFDFCDDDDCDNCWD